MSEPPRPNDVPYATAMTGRNGDGFGSLVPLVSGFGLLALGLLTSIFGQPTADHDIAEMVGFLVAVVGVGLAVIGVVVIFRALRKYDW